MITDNDKPRKRGRPPGRTDKGDERREMLYRTAIRMFSEQGYDQTTLRQIAQEADVSPSLIYKYFPSKVAVVLHLYDQLSLVFAEQAKDLPPGRWRDRAAFALRKSLEVLRPHREALKALIPVLVGDPEHSLFAESTSFSRRRVQEVFSRVVDEASDAPNAPLGPAIGNMLYVLQLGVLLWWLLDRSPRQEATTSLVELLSSMGGWAAMALWVPGTTASLITLDQLARRALFGEGLEGSGG